MTSYQKHEESSTITNVERLESLAAQRKDLRQSALLRFSLIAFLSDCFISVAAFLLAWYLRFSVLPTPDPKPFTLSSISQYSPQFFLGLVVLLLMMANSSLFHPRYLMRFRKSVVSVLQVIVYWGIGFLSISLMLKVDPEISRGYVILSMFFCSVGLILWRWFYASLLIRWNIGSLLKKRVLAIGWNTTSMELYEKVYRDDLHPISIYSVVKTMPQGFEEDPPTEVTIEGDYEKLPELLASRRFDAVLLVDFNLNPKQILEIQHLCMREMAEFMAIPSFYQVLLSRLEFDSVGGIPIMTGHNLPLDNPLNRAFKRLVDLTGGAFGLIICSPIIAFFCWRVYRESPGPVFYTQTRTGKNGKPFKILKIRSMRLNAEEQGGAQWAKKDDGRRLKVGEYMRKRNIDELPQFWNVLKGEMSLVGPRPERPELIRSFKYDIDNYNLRHAVKPGVTGWAAINGWRGDTDLQTRVAFDIEYMEKWNVWFDLYIMLKTFSASDNAY